MTVKMLSRVCKKPDRFDHGQQYMQLRKGHDLIFCIENNELVNKTDIMCVLCM